MCRMWPPSSEYHNPWRPRRQSWCKTDFAPASVPYRGNFGQKCPSKGLGARRTSAESKCAECCPLVPNITTHGGRAAKAGAKLKLHQLRCLTGAISGRTVRARGPGPAKPRAPSTKHRAPSTEHPAPKHPAPPNMRHAREIHFLGPTWHPAPVQSSIAISGRLNHSLLRDPLGPHTE